MMMPIMSGIDVYEALQSANPAQASKIVFLTGGALSERAQVFLEGCENRVIYKPFSSDKVRAAVGELLASG
jgi:CheY-like chemotaxis protein